MAAISRNNFNGIGLKMVLQVIDTIDENDINNGARVIIAGAEQAMNRGEYFRLDLPVFSKLELAEFIQVIVVETNLTVTTQAI